MANLSRIRDFVSYEIYRSTGADCTKDNAVLIETINDANNAEFTDLTPPVEERLCYYLKTVIQSGTLGESYLQTLNTYTLGATPVNLFEPTLINNTINLSWEESDMPYFSHYEISYSNFAANITGYAEQDIVITEITDKSIINFVDDNPPYLENPFYNIIVYDVFGNKTYNNPDGYITSWEVQYKRDVLLDIHRIFSYAIDPEEPVIYFYGYESGQSNSIKIHRYNYETNITEAISSLSPNTYTNLPIEIINSSYGKELVLEQGSELEIYDANTLEYKYTLEPSDVFSLNYFRYTSSGFWIFTDGDDVFTYSRDNSNLTLIDTKPHFSNFQSGYDYSIFEIENNQLLVGHINEPNSILYSMDSNGDLTNQSTVALPIKEYGTRKSQYNSTDNYIINFVENKLYSTTNFTLLESFNQPNFGSGISNDGKMIYGSNNDSNWSVNENSQHTKEAIIFNRLTQQTTTITTIGYPHVIFENYNGDVISISSGLKKEDLNQNINNKTDLFIEIIDVQ